MSRRADDLRRARGLLAAIDERTVHEVRAWSGGNALLTPSLPRVWDANYLRLDDPGGLNAAAIAREASELATDSGLHAATVVVEDETAARRVAAGLRNLGFERTRLVLMRLREPPPPPEHEVVEATFDEVRASRREILLEAFPASDELADELLELDRRLEASAGGRWFVIREGGAVISRSWLRGEDGVGQVEDVATAIAARGRGLARSVVSAAARLSVAAGDELTFVVADADDTTPRLYEKLGFEPMGVTHRFVKNVGAR